MSSDFTPEQKRYLEGFTSGLQIARLGRGPTAPAKPSGPDAEHIAAQDRVLAAGKKLSDQEKFKRDEHPFDAYHRLQDQAAKNEFPKPADNFRWRYYGLFYVAPAQNSYMCRLRIPNGIVKHWQLAGLADLAERYGGGYSHVTTRANFQIREIEPKNAISLLEAILDLGLCSKGTGADNIRNVTGTPTAGIDPQELLDTRPYARAWHHHILNERALYGLPRKFNVAFDGAGRIAALEDTNDIGFQAVEVKDGFGVEPGVWFRLALGGITGHRDFARDTGVVVKPADATKVADAIVRVFTAHGDRTDRNKARLKYVLDAMGFEKFLGLVEEKLGAKLIRVPAEAVAARPKVDRAAHIGVHAQKQEGLNWIGVVLPVGKLTGDQMRGLGQGRAGPGRRRYPAHGLAEPADLRRAGGQGCAGRSGDRGARTRDQGERDPRRTGRLHRQHRLPLRGVRHQASCRRDRALVRGARRAGHPGEHPSHRLPSFLRAALHRRHRPDRLQGASVGGGHGRGLSHPGRRRLRSGGDAGARVVPRRQGRRRAAHRREHAQDLSLAPCSRRRRHSTSSPSVTTMLRSTHCSRSAAHELAAAHAACLDRAGERAVHRRISASG